MPVEYRVLLVDDDRQFADLLSRRLLDSGYQLTELHHARHGLEAATLRDYDVVVVARTLPEIDGVRLMQILKGRIADLEAVILYDSNDPQDQFTALACGAFASLTKPCRLAEIEATIERAIEHRCERSETRRSSATAAAEVTAQSGLR